DINEDGHLDIVATHRTPVEYNSLHIWLGTGQGTFNEIPQTWPSPGYSGLAAGDINHDGHVDLIAGSHFNRLVTYLGDGKGQFTPSTLETQDGYVATRLVDVNGDGHLDAIALNCPAWPRDLPWRWDWQVDAGGAVVARSSGEESGHW